MLNLPTEYRDGDIPQKGVDLDTIQARSSARRALIIDDDPDTVDLIKIIFRNAGMDVVGAFSGKEAIQKCSDSIPSVILLDLMMPDMDGWETYSNIRQMTDAPVIVVSADTKKENVVRGLNTGFDDYVTKPFFPPELVARVNTVLRRAGSSQQVTKRVYPEIEMTIDFETHEVHLRGEEIHLSSREFALLEYLMRNSGKVVSKTMIMEHVWDYHFDPQTNVVEARICRLREKIEKGFDEKLIHTIRGVGYVLRPVA